MATYKVMTPGGRPDGEYKAQAEYIVSAETESEAIQRVRKGGGLFNGYLMRYSIPDYMCGFQIS